eukprot:12072059-Alexandrium_andersonii.AAC.1
MPGEQSVVVVNCDPQVVWCLELVSGNRSSAPLIPVPVGTGCSWRRRSSGRRRRRSAEPAMAQGGMRRSGPRKTRW